MRIPKAAAALLLATATSTAAMAGVGPAPAAAAVPSPKATRQTVVVNCYQAPQVRPSEIILTCADAGISLVRLHWSSWRERTATGRGLEQINDCIPNCAGGTFHSYPARVVLSKPVPWPSVPGTYRFTTLTIHYTGTRPPGQPREVTGEIP